MVNEPSGSWGMASKSKPLMFCTAQSGAMILAAIDEHWVERSTSAKVASAALRTPAVIVGADAHGLGMARSLGRAGVPVILADSDAHRPGLHTRFARPYLLPGISGAALIEGLLALRTNLSVRPILFLTTDLQVGTVSEYQERLGNAFHIRLPHHKCVRELLDKRHFQQLAERHGFPVPRAITVCGEQDFVNFAQIQFPAIIKPANKEYIRAPRALTVSSREQAESVCHAILAEAPELILQEWVEGRESDIYFCLQYRGENGVTVSSFTGRKLRCWPPQTGSTASCIAAPEMEDTLGRLTQNFFDRTGFVGLCSMEFKQDQRNRKFLMIEPTVGRTDWQEEVASINGVNIPLAAYRYELGLPPSVAQRPGAPQIWMYPPTYWRSRLVTKSFRDPRPRGARVKSACWSHDDPVPLAFFWREWLRDVFSRARWREFIFARAEPTVSRQYPNPGERDTRDAADLTAIKSPYVSPERNVQVVSGKEL